MYVYATYPKLTALSGAPNSSENLLLLLSSSELGQASPPPDLKPFLPHTPAARDAHVCKAESHREFLCGTISTPRQTKDGAPIAFGYLLTDRCMILCDDSGAAHTMLQHLIHEQPQTAPGPGSILYAFLELLIAKDMHHLQELEDRLEQMEDKALAGKLEGFNAQITALRKELGSWGRYYTQLDDLVCELQENESGLFREDALQMLHMVEKRIGRLRDEVQHLREYGVQVRELFQAEIEIRQNRIMQILTIVTTIFLPLSLVTGWYGMNFSGMPELTWRYGYPAIMIVSILVVCISLWIMKKKKFW